jgi:plasmid stability protein
MAQLLIRNVDDVVRNRLRARAIRHGRSMEEELRDILRQAADAEGDPDLPLGSWIAQRFAGIGLEADISELRGGPIRAADFEE